MNKTTLRVLTILLIVTIALIAATNIALAVSGSWYKNGVYKSGNHDFDWPPPSYHRMWGASSAQTPRGVIEYIYASMAMYDRCQNADGTWQAWNLYAANAGYANWAYSTGTVTAQGVYQSCVYGHDYWDQSGHHFRDVAFGIDDWHYLNSYP